MRAEPPCCSNIQAIAQILMHKKGLGPYEVLCPVGRGRDV